MTEAPDDFEIEERPIIFDGALVVDLEGYEGPIDMLLVLARQQKVDLLNISILQLANQYLKFIEEARRLRLEIAADYLVMAAWLAYLEAMQEAGAKIMELPRLGRDVFPRGAPEGVKVIRTPVYDLSLYELLRAYGNQQSNGPSGPLEIAPTEIFSVDDALERLGKVLGKIPDWTTLQGFLPESIHDAVVFRSAVASTFAASLELAKSGRLELRQSGTFSPIYVRSRAETG